MIKISIVVDTIDRRTHGTLSNESKDPSPTEIGYIQEMIATGKIRQMLDQMIAFIESRAK